MPSSRNARPSKKELWFPCGRYFLRTIKREDASDRWAGWLADPWTTHALNSAPAKLTKSDIVEYIKQFDQRSRLLLGIFERGTRLHVGFIRLDLDETRREAFVSAIIGEPGHRNRGRPRMFSFRCSTSCSIRQASNGSGLRSSIATGSR